MKTPKSANDRSYPTNNEGLLTSISLTDVFFDTCERSNNNTSSSQTQDTTFAIIDWWKKD